MAGIVERLREWPNKGLRRKLIFWSVSFWVLAITVLSFTILFIGQREILNQTRQRNVQIASVVSRDVNAQVSNIVSDGRIFARHLEALPQDMGEQADALLSLRLSAPQRYRAAYYFDAAGELLLHLTDTPEGLLSLKPDDIVFRSPIQLNDDIFSAYQETTRTTMSISDVRFAGIDRVPVIYIGLPLSFQQGITRIAVLQVDIRDIWQRVELSTVGATGFTYAVSRDGAIISHPDPTYIGRRIPEEAQPVLNGYEGFSSSNDAQGKSSVFVAYSPVGGPVGWGIIVQQKESETNAPLLRTAVVIIGVWIALAVIGTIGIIIMIGNFIHPIIELTKAAQNITETGKLSRITLEERADELGQLSHSFDRMIERLQDTEGRLVTAAADERNRLARDLHDAVSQTLFSASLIAEVLPRLWERNSEEGHRRLEEVRQLTRGALAEMRTLLLELRPTALVEAELPHLLQQLGESVTGRSRVPVYVSIEGECELPTDAKVAFYRIAQEALNNIAKHADAGEARVSLTCEAQQVTLTISDDGRGFEINGIASDSMGLGIMRERARDIGAALSIKSGAGKGTEVTTIWKKVSGESRI